MKQSDFFVTRKSPSQRIHLRQPEAFDREQVMAYRKEFLAIDSRMDGTCALNEYDDFDAWLANVRRYSSPETTPAGKVPSTQYLALDENEHLVGMVNLRHCLNDYLLEFGGHIGYSVRPADRKNGYAIQMLKLALDEAKALGIDRVRIACDRYNIASAKTIQANGGVLDGERYDPQDSTLTQRYWIKNT